MEKNVFRLGTVCSKIGSGATPTGGKEAYQGGGYKLIRSQNVVDLRFAYDGLAEINEEQAAKLNNVKVEEKDVLLNITGDSVARCCLAPIDILPARVNQHVAIIRPKAEILNPYYLLFWLIVNKQYLLALAAAGATRNGLTKAMISGLVLECPSLEKQNRIASILSTYDTLIENNTKRIRLLEKMAENLYKEWFVRFRFPGHENVEMEKGLPKGWKYCRLSKVSEYSNSKIPSEQVTFYVSTENMMKDFGGIDQNVLSRPSEGSATKVETGNILISNIRPYFKKIWFADKEAACSNDVLNIKAKDGIPPMFLYHSLKQDSFFRYMTIGSNGTKMPRGNKNFTMKYPIIIPTGNIMVVFSDIAIKLNKWGSILRQQNSLLARQRDLLLPRLMSGKLEVKM